MVAWVQDGSKFISCLLSWSQGWLELKLTVTTQGHEGVSYHISLAQERIKIQNLKYDFYFVGTAFAPL